MFNVIRRQVSFFCSEAANLIMILSIYLKCYTILWASFQRSEEKTTIVKALTFCERRCYALYLEAGFKIFFQGYFVFKFLLFYITERGIGSLWYWFGISIGTCFVVQYDQVLLMLHAYLKRIYSIKLHENSLYVFKIC